MPIIFLAKQSKAMNGVNQGTCAGVLARVIGVWTREVIRSVIQRAYARNPHLLDKEVLEKAIPGASDETSLEIKNLIEEVFDEQGIIPSNGFIRSSLLSGSTLLRVAQASYPKNEWQEVVQKILKPEQKLSSSSGKYEGKEKFFKLVFEALYKKDQRYVKANFLEQAGRNAQDEHSVEIIGVLEEFGLTGRGFHRQVWRYHKELNPNQKFDFDVIASEYLGIEIKNVNKKNLKEEDFFRKVFHVLFHEDPTYVEGEALYRATAKAEDEKSVAINDILKKFRLTGRGFHTKLWRYHKELNPNQSFDFDVIASEYLGIEIKNVNKKNLKEEDFFRKVFHVLFQEDPTYVEGEVLHRATAKAGDEKSVAINNLLKKFRLTGRGFHMKVWSYHQKLNPEERLHFHAIASKYLGIQLDGKFSRDLAKEEFFRTIFKALYRLGEIYIKAKALYEAQGNNVNDATSAEVNRILEKFGLTGPRFYFQLKYYHTRLSPGQGFNLDMVASEYLGIQLRDKNSRDLAKEENFRKAFQALYEENYNYIKPSALFIATLRARDERSVAINDILQKLGFTGSGLCSQIKRYHAKLSPHKNFQFYTILENYLTPGQLLQVLRSRPINRGNSKTKNGLLNYNAQLQHEGYNADGRTITVIKLGDPDKGLDEAIAEEEVRDHFENAVSSLKKSDQKRIQVILGILQEGIEFDTEVILIEFERRTSEELSKEELAKLFAEFRSKMKADEDDLF